MGLTLVTKTAKRAISMSATTVLPNAAKIFRSKEIRVRSLGRKAFFINNQC